MKNKTEKTLTLSSGFTFDYEQLYGEGKVTDADIFDLHEQICKAHEGIVHMRKTGIVKGHLSKDGEPEKVLFSQLPYIQEGHINSPSSIGRLKAFGQSLRYEVDAVISFGIGGSYLGNRVLFDMHCGELWNNKTQEERKGYPEFYFSGQDLDPSCTKDLEEYLIQKSRHKQEQRNEKYKVTMIVISKSGATLDTMSSFMVLYESLKNKGIEVQVVAVTDPQTGEKETLLRRLAKEYNWMTFSVPDGIGGRFSIFSEVGLITAACIGFEIEEFLSGARAMDEACQKEDLWQNPALLNAVLKYIAGEKYGKNIEVFMPYGHYLKAVAEWYVQLLAESLGKKLNRDGKEIFYGRTPMVAVGTTDMHSQTQLHQEGRLDKVIQFVKVEHWEKDPVIPDAFPTEAKLSQISSLSFSQALNIAYEANRDALAAEERLSATFVLPAFNAYHLGELLYFLALSIAYEGELANVDAFDQPGVEAYKRLMGPKLAALKEKEVI